MSKIHSLNKGKRFERKVAQLFTDAGFQMRRGRQYSGSPDSPDVKFVEHHPALPLHIECKHVEKLNIWSALDQARADCPEQLMPVVVFKRNHWKPHICMDLEDFFELLKLQ